MDGPFPSQPYTPDVTLLDDVKARLDIVQVVSETVALDTRSRTPKALCPFHAERTPSFVVFPETGTWRCFGACATGGDALSFIMKRDNVEFREALRQTADQLGIERRPGRTSSERSTSRDSKEKPPALRANEIALDYFKSVLDSPAGESARDYLAGRGITTEVAGRRDIGLSPDGMESLSGHLRAMGVTGAAAKGAGLVTQSRDGAWRDMFSGRLIFAIRDAGGRVIGFAGRSLDGAEPKYLNTPRTELFDKSSTLYGFDRARRAIRTSQTAVVVEGYTDTIAAHEAGFENVVASMGTAVTREQMALLTGNADTVVLALDPDAAGQEATLNALEALWGVYGEGAGGAPGPSRSIRTSIDMKVARLPPGRDPDELIRQSPDAWQAAIDDAEPLLDWLMEAYAARLDLSGADGKARITEAMFPMIALIANPYEQDRYLTRLAALVDVSIEALRANATRMRPVPRRRGPRPAAADSRAMSPTVVEGTERTLEEYLLALLLAYPHLRDYTEGLPEEAFLAPANRALFTAIRASDTIDGLRESVDEDIAQHADRLGEKSLPPTDQATRVADALEAVRRLHERHLRALKSQEERLRGDVDSGDVPDETRALIDQQTLDTNERLKHLFARHN